MLNGNNNNNNNNDNGNDDDDKSNKSSISDFSNSDVDGDGLLPPTSNVLAFRHQQLARKTVPLLLGATGSSINGSGVAAAAPVSLVITTTMTTTYDKNNNDNNGDSNGNKDNTNIDDEVVVVPKITTILDTANLNDIGNAVTTTTTRETTYPSVISVILT